MAQLSNNFIAMKLRNIACQFEDGDVENAAMVLETLTKQILKELTASEEIPYDRDGPR